MSTCLPLLTAALPWLGYGFIGTLGFLWLRKAFTPAWFLQLFESEGVPSTRLVLASIVIVFTLCMEAAGRIGDGLVQANFILAGTMLGLGTAKLVGKAFAARPPDKPAQISAQKAEVAVAGDAVVTNAPVTEAP